MSKHTPGPWHRNIKPATKYNTVWAGRNTHVARVVVDDRDLTADQIEANIALIAAAPDLLEALTALLQRAKRELADPEDVPEVAQADSVLRKLGDSV